MDKIYYIGEFPPKYNGVSVKNELVLEAMAGLDINVVDVVDFKRGIRKAIICGFRLAKALVLGGKLVIGLGKSSRRNFIIRIYKIIHGKKNLKNVDIMVMGGRFHKLVNDEKILKNAIPYIGTMWVESQIMIDALKQLGAKNVLFFPNCRRGIKKKAPRKRDGKEIKFLYFSVICKAKGIEAILNLADYFSEINCHVDFYGEIVLEDKEYFEREIGKCEYFNYCGIFDAVKNDVYALMNSYDVLLFPTMWKGEGVSGALIESKFAAITAIATDWNFNKEVITDGVDGLLISTGDNLKEAIERLIAEDGLLDRLKTGAVVSSEKYMIENYSDFLKSTV